MIQRLDMPNPFLTTYNLQVRHGKVWQAIPMQFVWMYVHTHTHPEHASAHGTREPDGPSLYCKWTMVDGGEKTDNKKNMRQFAACAPVRLIALMWCFEQVQGRAQLGCEVTVPR